MADPDRIADALLALVDGLRLKSASVDEHTIGGQRFADRLASSAVGVRLLERGCRGGRWTHRIDLVHLASTDSAASQLAALDQVWPALSERAIVVMEDVASPATTEAAQVFRDAAGAAWLTEPASGLVGLTENARLAEGCAKLGWTTVAPWASSFGAGKSRRVRLLGRAPAPRRSPATLGGDSAEWITAAANRLGEIRLPPYLRPHLRRHTFTDARVFGDMTVLGSRGPLREIRRMVTAEQTRLTVERLADRPWPELDRALLIGVSARSNYFHWMVESLFSLWLSRRLPGPPPSPALAPVLDTYQAESLDLLGLRDGVLPLSCDEGREVGALTVFSPVFGEQSFDPSPWLRTMFADLLAAARLAEVASQPGGRRLFISRIDSPSRPLVNEAALQQALAARGFETVVLSGRSIAEQALMFAQAEVVVGPHGAGLTNLGFCSAGTKVLELTPGHYVNPCFLAISALGGLDHHLYVGTPEAGDLLRHRRRWSVEVDQVMEQLDAVLPS